MEETSHYLNLDIKYLISSKNYCKFTGQEFTISDDKLWWRTLPERLEKWQNPPSQLHLPEALGFVAIIIRESQIRHRSLAHVQDVLTWLSVTTHKVQEDNWRTQLVGKDLHCILEKHQSFFRPQWTHLPRFQPKNPLVIACDATPTSVAYLTMTHGNFIIGNHLTNTTPIATNEAKAILLGVTQLFTIAHDAIVVLSDNQPASKAIIKGYSAEPSLSCIASSLTSLIVPIIIYDVASEENIADFPSRNLDLPPPEHPSVSRWFRFVRLAHSEHIISSKWVHRSTW